MKEQVNNVLARLRFCFPIQEIAIRYWFIRGANCEEFPLNHELVRDFYIFGDRRKKLAYVSVLITF
jgi:hypothetical protein